MKNIFLIGLSICLSHFVLAAELTPPPPPPLLQPPSTVDKNPGAQPSRPSEPVATHALRVILKCDVDQYILNCEDRGFCSAGPSFTPNLVRVVLQQKKTGQIELVTNLNGDVRLIHTSKQAMNCDLPSYFCQSQNGQEVLQIQQVQSAEYGTLDFTVVVTDHYPWTAFSVGATAAIRCQAPRN